MERASLEGGRARTEQASGGEWRRVQHLPDSPPCTCGAPRKAHTRHAYHMPLPSNGHRNPTPNNIQQLNLSKFTILLQYLVRLFVVGISELLSKLTFGWKCLWNSSKLIHFNIHHKVKHFWSLSRARVRAVIQYEKDPLARRPRHNLSVYCELISRAGTATTITHIPAAWPESQTFTEAVTT